MEHMDSFAAVFEGVVAEIRAKFKDASEHAGIIESFQAFVAAVDWTEPWLMGVLAFEVLLLAAVLLFRKNEHFQTVVFLSAACTIYMAQKCNSFLARHWEKFAGQPYFDKDGIFISAVLSGPLVFIMFVQLVNFLVQTSKMLVQMKTKELKYKARQRAKQAQGDKATPKPGGQSRETAKSK
eukprot:jgi/Botrbrau1/7320/Bobra.247_3s0015.1